MRGTFGNLSRSVSYIATISVATLLTIASGANLNFAGGVGNAALFLDGSKNATSSGRILMDGNDGTVTSTRFHANGTALTDGYNIRITGLQGTYGTDGTNLALGTQTGDSIRFYTSNVSRWDINSSGNIVPSLTDGTLNIGAAASRVGTGFFTNVSSTLFSGPAGSAGAPTYTFSADTDTGLFQSSVAALDVAVNGTRYAKFAASAITLGGNTTPIMPFADGNTDIGDVNTRFDKIFGNDLGSYATPFSTIHASTTAGSAHDVITTTGTVKMANLAALAATGDFVCENNTTAGAIQVQAANCTVSSAYFKKHIESLSPSEMMGLVRELRAVEYDRKDDNVHEKGFIAEEVARIDPTLVVYVEAKDKNQLAFTRRYYPDTIIVKDGKTLIPRTVDYMRFTVVLTAAMQNLDERLMKLESK